MSGLSAPLGGDTNEKENLTDTAEEEGAQRGKEVDESVEERSNRMRVTQKQNCLGQTDCTGCKYKRASQIENDRVRRCVKRKSQNS